MTGANVIRSDKFRITIETVSRQLTRLRAAGIISVEGTLIAVLRGQ